MFEIRFGRKKKEPENSVDLSKIHNGFFNTSITGKGDRNEKVNQALANSIQKGFESFKITNKAGASVALDAKDSGIDDSTDLTSVKSAFSNFRYGGMNEAQLLWYGQQGFIGFQMCAILAQHWLIDKACTMPARDAIRNGYKIVNTADNEVDDAILVALKEVDKSMNLEKELVEFSRKSRIFGIRIAMFLIDSSDPDYYAKPFNLDSVTKGSYQGISQIDPYWISPELDLESSIDPKSPFFQVPTWWRIGGKRVHRTHLIIAKTNEVPDILKPSYLYAGVSVPQKIYERVYAAERTANEGPNLAMSKRLTTLKMDLTAALSDGLEELQEHLEEWTRLRDNYGVKIIGENEEIQQIDTALGDLDAVIMTQYQIVASAANIPATKLLGTVPKGFNTTGEYEANSYHEELESIQTDEMAPFIMRHHQLAIRSEIAPQFKMAPFETTIAWEPLDSPSAQEEAAINKTKSEVDMNYSTIGAVDGNDIRRKLKADPNSGYNFIDGEDEDSSAAKNSLTGPQVTALIQILGEVASGMLPYESGLESLKISFQIDDEEAAALLGTIGKGFVPNTPEPPPVIQGAGTTNQPNDKKTFDSSDMHFDSRRGLLNGAQLITTQKYLDQNIVQQKRDDQDFLVQVSPEIDVNGNPARIVLDGHHSLNAAIQSGNMPTFKQMTGHDKRVKALKVSADNMLRVSANGEGNYHNIVTKAEVYKI